MTKDITLNSTEANELQKTVEEKLISLDIPSESIIAEFVTVMVANGKSKDQMNAELCESLGLDDFGPFLDWLEEHLNSLSKLNQTTHMLNDSSKKRELGCMDSNADAQDDQGKLEEDSGKRATKKFKPIVWDEEDVINNPINVSGDGKSKKFSNSSSGASIPAVASDQNTKENMPTPKKYGSSNMSGQIHDRRQQTQHAHRQHKQDRRSNNRSTPYDLKARQVTITYKTASEEATSVSTSSYNNVQFTRKQQYSQPVAPKIVECKFGAMCLNPECKFSHPSPAMIMQVASTSSQVLPQQQQQQQKNKSNIYHQQQYSTYPSFQGGGFSSSQSYFNPSMNIPPCRYWPNCLNPHCTFYHPQTNTKSGGASATTHLLSQVPCRYDPACKRPECPYLHPSKSANASGVSSSGTTGSKSQRIFALDESETEKLTVGSNSNGDSNNENGEGNDNTHSNSQHQQEEVNRNNIDSLKEGASDEANQILRKASVTAHAERIGVSVKVKEKTSS